MYDELVNRLKEDKSWVEQGTTQTEHEIAEHIQQAADAIEELSRDLDSMNEANIALYGALPKWIPVTERLPKDDDKRFLVCAKRFNGEPYMNICYHAKNLHEFDEYDFPNENRPGWYFYDSEYGWVEKEDVTHWMPLPTPPKEEKIS